MSFTIARQLQKAVVQLLQALPALDGLPVIGSKRASVASQVDEALGARGLCLYVFPGLPVDVNPNLPGPYADQVEIRVRVYENEELNNTELDAYQVAELALTGLHESLLATFPGLEGANPIQCLARPITDVSDDTAVMFDLTFRTSVGLPASAT